MEGWPKINLKTILVLVIVTLILIRFKRLFFMSLFISLNLFMLYLKKMGVFIPVKIIEFGTFIVSYAYGSMEGIIISSISFVSLLLMDSITFYRILINLLLILFALLIPYLRVFPVVMAGIIFLTARTITDLLANFLIFGDPGSIKKNLKRAIDFTFWIGFYLLFGNTIYRIMV